MILGHLASALANVATRKGHRNASPVVIMDNPREFDSGAIGTVSGPLSVTYRVGLKYLGRAWSAPWRVFKPLAGTAALMLDTDPNGNSARLVAHLEGGGKVTSDPLSRALPSEDARRVVSPPAMINPPSITLKASDLRRLVAAAGADHRGAVTLYMHPGKALVVYGAGVAAYSATYADHGPLDPVADPLDNPQGVKAHD